MLLKAIALKQPLGSPLLGMKPWVSLSRVGVFVRMRSGGGICLSGRGRAFREQVSIQAWEDKILGRLFPLGALLPPLCTLWVALLVRCLWVTQPARWGIAL